MIALRPYQADCIQAMLDYWASGGGNPLASLATGLGKSVIIAKLTRDVLAEYRDMRVLMLVHVRELVEQNFRALLNVWPDAPAGIYSAGLGRRDAHHRITFASIQSVYKKAREIGPRDLILIDECHLVPAGGEGMYRTLLDGLYEQRPDARVAGFTATPFRLDSGRLDTGAERLFDQVVYSYDIGDGIRDGWLSGLISKASATEIDVGSVARRGGEFVAGALEAASDRDDVTRAAAAEMLRYGGDRRSWLVFCAGIKHAAHVRDELRRLGILAETVTGDTPAAERARLIRDFRAGRIRALTNAQVLTTGFDAPGVDLIAFLRPTLSTGLYLQMVGRGVRKAEGKADCLVLDFAGNVRRHGPVDAAMPRDKRAKAGEAEAKATVETVRAKMCPECMTLTHLSARACTVCGFEWPIEVKPTHEAEADDTPILSTERPAGPETIPVVSWTVSRHTKFGSPDSLKVTYFAGLMTYPEWWMPEHAGFMADKFARLWRRHGGGEAPETVTEALARWGELTPPTHIQVRRNGKFWDVVGRTIPERREEAA